MTTIDYTGSDVVVIAADARARAVMLDVRWTRFVPTAKNGQPRGWYAPANKLLAVTEALRGIAEPSERALTEIRRRRFAALNIRTNTDVVTSIALRHANDALDRLQKTLGIKPFDHQRAGIRRMIEWRAVINADAPGLGKTMQATVAAYALQRATATDSVLVLSPKTAIDNWRSEVRMLTDNALRYTIHTWASIPEPPEEPYILIADEAHLGKAGFGTLRGHDFLRLALNESCIACYPMTGSPAPNGRPMEYWPLLAAVRAPHAEDVASYKVLAEDRLWLHQTNQPYVIRRTREDCPGMPDLPIRTLHQVPRSDEAEAHFIDTYNAMRDDYYDRIGARIISDEAYALAQLTHLTHAGSLAKVEFAVAMAEEILEGGQPVVIFTQFKDAAQQIGERLARHGVEVLTGESKRRGEMVRRFQAGESSVFVMTQTGGLAITLTRAHNLIMVDRLWTPEYNDQIEKRVDRITQKEVCRIFWLEFDRLDRYRDSVNFWKMESINMINEGFRKSLHRIERPNFPTILQEIVLSGPF